MFIYVDDEIVAAIDGRFDDIQRSKVREAFIDEDEKN
jgi:hypothetical protein